jgi:hypothetical protein
VTDGLLLERDLGQHREVEALLGDLFGVDPRVEPLSDEDEPDTGKEAEDARQDQSGGPRPNLNEPRRRDGDRDGVLDDGQALRPRILGRDLLELLDERRVLGDLRVPLSDKDLVTGRLRTDLPVEVLDLLLEPFDTCAEALGLPRRRDSQPLVDECHELSGKRVGEKASFLRIRRRCGDP